ncbi:uncharacterized protein LOC132044455 [Lycium ferocissimum]|uniref:uncharacterized protein LOC132044455 n=1 Tax=Lycium ferocissimum TaxID=112874 RepID=UPI00281501E1|nr:uncharacterized protein LOC132044455 [Lycium ferocissimum]
MIIPGPSSPGNDIDVYLQPLIAELKELWEAGIETYDAETNQTFRMRAALLWTVSDFPALAMVSGWSTKGKLACPTCNYDTCSQYLNHSRKMCYMGHRRFLLRDHPLRKDKKSFNGQEEHRPAPTPLSGVEVFEELREFNNVYGKGKKKKGLGIIRFPGKKDGKSKDHVNSRYDLQEMGIRKELQPIEDDNGCLSLARACFSMKPEQKRVFCTVIKNAKLPKGYASNISQRVQVKEMKISGYKSHDAHFIMHYLLQVAVRKALPKNVSLTLIRSINSRGVLAEECLTFCSRYLHDGVKTRFSRYQTEDDDCLQNLSPIFPNIGHPIGREKKKRNTFLMDSQSKDEAHRYALFNTGDEQVEKLIEEHKNLIVPDYLRGLAQGPNSVAKRYTAYFINGYRFHTKTRDAPRKTQNSGVTLSATTDSFASARDQNPIDGEVIYYGVIQDIIEIDYYASQVPVDFYDLEEENCPNIRDTFWREPNDDIGSSSRLPDVDNGRSREDMPVDVVDVPFRAQDLEETIRESSEEEDDIDDTDWDWMEEDD